MFRKAKFFSKFISSGMLSLFLGTLSAQVVQAQRPISLLDLKCIETRSSNWLRAYNEESKDISIGRTIYTTVMWVNSSGEFTCQLPATKAASLRLKFGMEDRVKGAAPVTIDVYLDGNQLKHRTASPGKLGTEVVDISNGKSLTIETNCARATNCGEGVFFIEAQIEPAAESPGRKN